MAWTLDEREWTCPECGKGYSWVGTESYYDPRVGRVTVTRRLPSEHTPCAPDCPIGKAHRGETAEQG